jgi:hypothetical protein
MAVAPSPPPQIYHIITTPLCARLHERVRPAVALILQNDSKIGKSAPLFHTYQRGVLTGPATDSGGGAPLPYDSINTQSPQTSMALQQMSYLVSPIAQNLIAAQTMLDAHGLVEPTGNAGDDKTLALIKEQLLQTVAFQSASLDLVNGFVTTQQMGELQHAGETYIASIQGGNDTQGIATAPTPNPLEDPNAPGLSPNPYEVNLAAVPGLALGYNPLSRVIDGLQWLRDETDKREATAAATLTSAMNQCNRTASK